MPPVCHSNQRYFRQSINLFQATRKLLDFTGTSSFLNFLFQFFLCALSCGGTQTTSPSLLQDTKHRFVSFFKIFL